MSRHIRFLAVLGVVLYAVAVGHQLLPHGADHGDGEHCPFCVLLFGLALLFPVFGALFVRLMSPGPWFRLVAPYTRLIAYSTLLRAPPAQILSNR